MAVGTPLIARDTPFTVVAVYRRTIHASLARIWENVLDWEHLPWLHRTSFLAIRLLDADRDGWRAQVTLPSAAAAYEIELDVRLDRPHLRYSSRTVAGRGTGSEILTRLNPVGPHATEITVEFRVPGVPAAQASAVGNAYVRLYTHLWDEDEAMMKRRQALLDGTLARHLTSQPAPVPLGDVATLRARLPLVIDADGRKFRLVELDGTIVAHDTICPHLGGPLDVGDVADGCVTCPWHGYRFDLRTGRNRDGRDCHLDPAPRVEIDPRAAHAFLTWT